MDPEAAQRFAALVADPTHDPPLDEGALLIAATAAPVDVDAWLARLDDMAGAALAFPEANTPQGLARVLFVEWAYAGNTTDYRDPRNSFLPDVVDRRLGLPITLSVLMIEIGRRIGLRLHGVGMPGHFLVGVDGNEELFVDPFHAGVILDRAGCRERFVAQYGERTRFDESFLSRTDTRATLLRMLNNLQQTYVAQRSSHARWVASLRLAFPELDDSERSRLAEVLASVGAFDEASTVLETLVQTASADERATLIQRAVAFRSRSN